MQAAAEASSPVAPPKKALITGITGQDGSYLAELLISKGYEVHGVLRRASGGNMDRLHKRADSAKIILHYGDITDSSVLITILLQVKPDEIYHLAAQSSVAVSFQMAEHTASVNGMGTLRILEAIRAAGQEKHIRLFNASSSEMYGKVIETPQTEKTPFYPRSPYAVSKQFAHWMCVNYREAYGMFVCNGILFNHDSPRRGLTFVTRKITHAVARISKGLQDCLWLGNLDIQRDWGHAREYTEAMWLMLQQKVADDYVVATGECHTVREFCQEAFHAVGVTIRWEGSGLNEIGICSSTGKVLVRIDPKFFRPTEVDVVRGDASKAQKILNWKPQVKFSALVREMVEADVSALENDLGDEMPEQKFEKKGATPRKN